MNQQEISNQARQLTFSKVKSRLIHLMLSRNFVFLTICIITINLMPAQSVGADNLAAQLPDIGEAGSNVLSPREERQLGREFMRSVRNELVLLNDPFSTMYLQKLADKLQPKTTDNTQEITIFIVTGIF